MTDTPVTAWLRRTCAEILAVPEERLTPDALFTEDLEADSLDIADIGVELSKEGIELSTTDVMSVRTFGDLTRLVCGHAATTSPS